jgi:hypothetical protein
MPSANSLSVLPLLEEVKQVAVRGKEPLPDKIPRGNHPKRGPFGGRLTTFLVLATPAFWLGWLIFQYGVDTPWGDQWDATRLLFEKMEAGTLGFADFFAFHNEHRIFFPQLLSFAIARLTHWNIRAELLVIWLLACAVALNIWRIARSTSWRNSRDPYWLLLGANILIFSPLQWENMLWGFQIVFLLPLATVTASLWTACSFRRPFNFVVTAALCLISTFSIASGFTSWLLATPLLLMGRANRSARGEKMWLIAWTTLAIASLCIYFDGFKHPPDHPNPILAFQHPILASQFFLAYVGNPFCSGTAFDRAVIAQLAGAALLVPLFAALAYLYRSRHDRVLVANTLPWISLIGFTLANALLTTAGRFGFGMRGAMQSRYVSFAILLPVGLLFFLALIFQHWHARRPAIKRLSQVSAVFASLITALALLLLGATIQSLQFWRLFHHDRLTGKAALLFINVIDEPEALVRYIHWSHWTLKDWANNLDRIGYMHPRLVRSPSVREIIGHSSEGDTGEFNKFVRSSTGQLAASGWAILPSGHRVADSVLLTYDNAGGEPIIFARADVIEERSDVSEKLHDNEYCRCGWMKSWKPAELPEGTRRISAWAFDAEKCRAYAIGGAAL